MLKHRTHPELYKSSRLKVDFCIQLLVKFQILIHFLRQMLDFCLGCGNKKCWVWFPALIFLLLTFLFFWGNPYQAMQPVKTTIFSCRKITFEQELASYRPVFLQSSCSDSAECKFEKVWGSKICSTVQLAWITSS